MISGPARQPIVPSKQYPPSGDATSLELVKKEALMVILLFALIRDMSKGCMTVLPTMPVLLFGSAAKAILREAPGRPSDVTSSTTSAEVNSFFAASLHGAKLPVLLSKPRLPKVGVAEEAVVLVVAVKLPVPDLDVVVMTLEAPALGVVAEDAPVPVGTAPPAVPDGVVKGAEKVGAGGDGVGLIPSVGSDGPEIVEAGGEPPSELFPSGPFPPKFPFPSGIFPPGLLPPGLLPLPP